MHVYLNLVEKSQKFPILIIHRGLAHRIWTENQIRLFVQNYLFTSFESKNDFGRRKRKCKIWGLFQYEFLILFSLLCFWICCTIEIKWFFRWSCRVKRNSCSLRLEFNNFWENFAHSQKPSLCLLVRVESHLKCTLEHIGEDHVKPIRH